MHGKNRTFFFVNTPDETIHLGILYHGHIAHNFKGTCIKILVKKNFMCLLVSTRWPHSGQQLSCKCQSSLHSNESDLITSVKTFSGSKTVSDFCVIIVAWLHVNIALFLVLQGGTTYLFTWKVNSWCSICQAVSTARPPSGPLLIEAYGYLLDTTI